MNQLAGIITEGQAKKMMEVLNEAKFRESSTVTTPDGKGIIVKVSNPSDDYRKFDEEKIKKTKSIESIPAGSTWYKVFITDGENEKVIWYSEEELS